MESPENDLESGTELELEPDPIALYCPRRTPRRSAGCCGCSRVDRRPAPIRSAHLPCSSVPRSFCCPRNSAELFVAAVMTCAGVMPASTISSSSMCSPNPSNRVSTPLSVPYPMRTPASASRFRFSFAFFRTPGIPREIFVARRAPCGTRATSGPSCWRLSRAARKERIGQ